MTSAAPARPTPAVPSRRGPLLGALVAAAVGAAALGAVALVAHHGSHHATRPAPASEPVDRLVVGRVGAAPLQAEGQPIRVELGGGSVVATVAGPVVPGQGLPYIQSTTTCTFTVTFAGGTVPVPLAASDFRVLDQRGRFDGLVVDPGTAPPPAVLRPGQRATFYLRAVLPTGQGIMSYASDGTHVQGKWDFVVEND